MLSKENIDIASLQELEATGRVYMLVLVGYMINYIEENI